MKEKIYFVCLQKICFKDNDKPAHWVDHSKLISLDMDELFKRITKFDKNQASIIENTEEQDNVAEKTTDDVDEM